MSGPPSTIDWLVDVSSGDVCWRHGFQPRPEPAKASEPEKVTFHLHHSHWQTGDSLVLRKACRADNLESSG